MATTEGLSVSQPDFPGAPSVGLSLARKITSNDRARVTDFKRVLGGWIRAASMISLVRGQEMDSLCFSVMMMQAIHCAHIGQSLSRSARAEPILAAYPLLA
jgi:hypothetical protein